MFARCLALILLNLFMVGSALARPAQICPAQPGQLDRPPADWRASGCEETDLRALDPNDRILWVRTEMEAPQTEQPVMIYISGHFSSRFWLNGREIGRNGLPGADAMSEAPGRMDAAIPIPEGTLRAGTNAVTMLVSGHHGIVDLGYPFHNLRFVALDPNERRREVATAPVMIALGLFLAGAVYFGGLAVTRAGRGNALILFGLSLMASGQLLAEIARPLWAYPYPVHGWRLLMIAGCSTGFGLLACFYVVRRLKPRWLWPVMIVAGFASAAALWLQSGFDAKSAFSMLGPLLCALTVSVYVAVRPHGSDIRRKAVISALALLAVIAPNILIPDLFLNAVFFYLVAGLLLILLADQVRERSREQAEAVRETARADRLQLLLDQLEPDSVAPPLIIRSAGKVEQIPIADISTVQGADGYAEIRLTNGRTILHTKSLTALESDLPASFLKVHRSHIVNTHHVRALEREPSGTGALLLSDGERVPVSRRILPRVREALG